jgi:hypothetical protein
MRRPPTWGSDVWSNELVVRQSPACKNMSMEAEDPQQATTGEDSRIFELAISL